MEHIFEITETQPTPTSKRGVNVYSSRFSCPEAQEALEKGTFYWKVDGACGMVRYNSEEDELEVYERQDTRGREASEDLVPLRPGENQHEYGKDKDRHTYFMRKVAITDEDGKKQKKIKAAILDVLKANRDVLISACREHGKDGWLSVELVGTKFQKTPGVEDEVAIALHKDQNLIIDGDLPRSYDEAKKFLGQRSVEGIVVEWNGRYWKLRSNLMDPSCLFETNRIGAPPPNRYFRV